MPQATPRPLRRWGHRGLPLSCPKIRIRISGSACQPKFVTRKDTFNRYEREKLAVPFWLTMWHNYLQMRQRFCREKPQNDHEKDHEIRKASDTNGYSVFVRGSNPSSPASFIEKPRVEKLPAFSLFCGTFSVIKRFGSICPFFFLSEFLQCTQKKCNKIAHEQSKTTTKMTTKKRAISARFYMCLTRRYRFGFFGSFVFVISSKYWSMAAAACSFPSSMVCW